jgi:WS/DGAT/MGAT family acyltransferase
MALVSKPHEAGSLASRNATVTLAVIWAAFVVAALLLLGVGAYGIVVPVAGLLLVVVCSRIGLGPLGGKVLWVDDSHFDIQHHVHATEIAQPVGDLQLLDAAARIYSQLLDRSRPPWELWFLTGLSAGRVGVLLKLHHCVADGMATVAIMTSLFDFEPDAPDPAPEPWVPAPVPRWWSLLVDNFSNKLQTVWRVAGMLGRPTRLVRRARTQIKVGRVALGAVSAPRTSLNQVVRSGRRIRFLRIDLEAMKRAAHAHDAKVNDVVLDLWSGALRALMLARGEPTSGIELITDMPVSLRRPDELQTIHNELGFMALPLPVWDGDPGTRLDRIVQMTRKAKSEQQSAVTAGFLAFASGLPMAKYLSAHQHSVNAKVSNVIGPPLEVYVLGARILDILPITRLFGNVGFTLCAFSYAAHIYLVVTADARAFPDLDVLMGGMEREWNALIGSRVHEAMLG